jgi:hypothetical protein
MLHASLLPFQNQVAIFNVCGDAEAFVFDFAALPAAQQAALVAAHLQAFEANLRRQKRSLVEFTPFALLGTSMPAAAQSALDLSAPHEGTLLIKNATGSVLYVTAANDHRAFFVADSIDALGLRESSARVRGPLDFTATPTATTGFTLEQYAIVGNKLAQVIGKHTGVIGIFERMLASS